MSDPQIQIEDFAGTGPAAHTDLVEKKIQEADLYLNHGLTQEARAILTEILAVFPDDGDSQLKIQLEEKLKELSAEDALGMEKKDGATDEKLSRDEQFMESFNNCLGLMEAGFFSEAVEELKILEKQGFRTGEVDVKIGQLYLKLDMPFEAIEYLTKGLEDMDLPTEIIY